MRSITHPDILKRIEDTAVEYVMVVMSGVIDSLIADDGQVYGDLESTGGDFITFYNDLIEHTEVVPLPQMLPDGTETAVPTPVQVRVLDMLRVVGPKHADRLDREYQRQIGRMVE